MKLSYNHMIQIHIEKETNLIKLCRELALHEFGRYLDKARGEGWELREITERDLIGYFNYLAGLERDMKNIFKRMDIILEFIEFAARYNWIDKSSWKNIAPAMEEP